jgi:RND superfamily putative drug exporter
VIHLADFCYRRRRLVLVTWVVALVAFIMLGGAITPEHRANYRTPNAESTAAYDLLGERFPVRQGDSIKLVFAGDLSDPSVQAQAERVIEKIGRFPDVAAVESPFVDGGEAQIASNGRIGYAEVHFDKTFDDLQNDDADYQTKFLEAADPGLHGDLRVEVTTFVGVVEPGSEFIGLIFAAIVLAIAFGSVLAMGLPLLMALFGLGIGMVLGGFASRIVETPDWAATVALMIGLGVGIDYALFIITRYRNSLGRGSTPREATITAMGTAGRAVMFAGATVIISLLGMLTMGLSYLHGVAASAVLGVLAVLAASLTLLPAVLGFVGTRIDKWRVPFTGRPSHQGDRAFWYRWSRVVQRRPWLSFVGAAIFLLVLTIPLFSLRLGFPTRATTRSPRRRAAATTCSRTASDRASTAHSCSWSTPNARPMARRSTRSPTRCAGRGTWQWSPTPWRAPTATPPSSPCSPTRNPRTRRRPIS